MKAIYAKPYIHNPNRREFRTYTLRQIKNGSRVRITTTQYEIGKPKQDIFQDFKEWSDAYNWYTEVQDEDTKDGWSPK